MQSNNCGACAGCNQQQASTCFFENKINITQSPKHCKRQIDEFFASRLTGLKRSFLRDHLIHETMWANDQVIRLYDLEAVSEVSTVIREAIEC